MKGFLNCNFGSKSSKRLAGILMIFVGIVVKVGLVIYGANIKIEISVILFFLFQ